MHSFSRERTSEGSPISLKIRVVSGCFHREDSPHAYRLILAQLPSDAPFDLLEHESGPELLVYAAVTAGALNLAKSVIDFVTTILKARSEGIKQGDRPNEPLEVIVRRDLGNYREEVAIRVPPDMAIESSLIEGAIADALRRLDEPDDL